MAKASSQVPEIDRLIDDASDGRGPSAGGVKILSGPLVESSEAGSLNDLRDTPAPIWRILLQLRGILPHLVRALPLIERGVLGTNVLGSLSTPAASVDTSHFDRGIAEMEGANRDLSRAVKNQAGEIKYLQEQITWLGKSLEKAAGRQEEIAESLTSLRKLAAIWGIAMATLLTGLIAAVALLASQRSR